MTEKFIEKYTPEEFYFKLYKDNTATREEFNRLKSIYYRWEDLIKYHARLYHPKGEKRLEKYSSISIDRRASYIILGSMDLLTEFSAYYLTTFGDCRYGYIKYDLKDFAFQYDLDKKLKVDDILFLTSRAKEPYYGNTQRAVYTNIIHETCSRKNENQITILLLEENIQCFVDSGEFKVIDLYKLFNRKKSIVTQTTFSTGNNTTQTYIEDSTDFDNFLEVNRTKFESKLGKIEKGSPNYNMLKNTYNKYKDEDLEGKINLLLNVV